MKHDQRRIRLDSVAAVLRDLIKQPHLLKHDAVARDRKPADAKTVGKHLEGQDAAIELRIIDQPDQAHAQYRQQVHVAARPVLDGACHLESVNTHSSWGYLLQNRWSLEPHKRVVWLRTQPFYDLVSGHSLATAVQAHLVLLLYASKSVMNHDTPTGVGR